jgi:chromosomal replication initiation ATPase DnaA
MTPEEAWEVVLDILRNEKQKVSYYTCYTYLRETQFISYAEGKFIIGTPTQFTSAWLTARMTSTVERMLAGMMNREVEVEFRVQEKQ